MATIASMIYSIEAQTSSIEQSMTRVATLVDDVDKSMLQNIISGNLLSDAFEKLGELAVASLEKIADAFPALLEHTIDVGNSLYEMSLKTGASVENLSALRYVASQTGIDFDSFGTTLYKMEQALGSSGQKAVDLQGKLDLLGLSLQTLKNEKPDDAFIAIMSALEEMPNRADQAAIGLALFGKGFKEMAGLTQESIGDLIQEAKDLGLVMGTEQAAAAHAAEVGWKSFSMQLESVAMSVGATVLPALVALESLATSSFKALKDSVGGNSGTGVTGSIQAMGETIIVATAAMAGFIEGSISGLRSVGNFALTVGDALVAVARLDPTKNLTGAAADINRVSSVLGTLRTGLNAGADAGTKFFAGIEGIADSMAGKFSAAYDAASAKIQDYANKSHAAFGGVGSDVDAGQEKVDAYTKAWEALNAVGATVYDTMGGLTQSQINLVRYYADAKASVHDIATALGLQVDQVQSVIEVDKALENVEDTKNQNSLNWVKLLGSAKQTASLQEMHDTVTSIEQTQQLWTQYYDTLGQASMSTTEKQIADVQHWFDSEVLKIKDDDENWLAHYDALYAVAQQKMQAVYQEHSKMFQDTKKLLADLTDGPGGWIDTFSTVLVHTGSFTGAMSAAWKLMKDDTLNIFADLLGGIIHSFLDALLKAVEDYVAKMLIKLALLTIFSFFSGGGIAGVGGGGGGGSSSSGGGVSDGAYASTGGVIYAAAGWPIARGTDTVPAMLTPGEGILSTSDMAALGGQTGFNAFRKSLHGIAGSSANSASADGDINQTFIFTIDGKQVYKTTVKQQKRDLLTRRKLAAA